MRIPRRTFRKIARRAVWILSARVLLTLIVLVFAASITITQKNYQVQIGGVISVANNLFATDKGFTVAGSALSATSCIVPIVFGVQQTANTNITAGHLVYDVQVNSTLLSPIGTNFNVTLVLSGTPYGPVCIKTAASPLVGTIDCKIDVGTQLPPSPYSFKVTIA